MWDSVKDDSDFQVTSQIGNHVVGLYFNHSAGPFKDLRVRKAISHAIDRKALVKGLEFGQGIPASAIFHDTHWSHNPALKPVTYDPELSRKLLAEAGYGDGLNIKGHWGTTIGNIALTEAIKDMLEKVGVNWTVDSLDAAASFDRFVNLEYDMCGGGAGYLKEPDMVATGHFHPDGATNRGRMEYKELTEIIERGKVEMDLAKRQQIYWELEKTIYDMYADVWLWYPIINTARSKQFGAWYNTEDHTKGGEAYWFSHAGFFIDGKEQADAN
jgi:peptide/nickel transport system substrate-binding protein